MGAGKVSASFICVHWVKKLTDMDMIMVVFAWDCNGSSVFVNREPRILVSCELKIMTANKGILRHLLEHESVLVRYNLVDITCSLVDSDNHSSRMFFKDIY